MGDALGAAYFGSDYHWWQNKVTETIEQRASRTLVDPVLKLITKSNNVSETASLANKHR